MKKLFVLAVLALLTINITCGGSGSSSKNTSGRTTVTISLGETRTASQAGGSLHTASANIPSNVTSIMFTISAPDMATMTETVPVAGQPTITKTFEIPNGPNRHFLVEAKNEALNPPDHVIYKGETYANMTGTPMTLAIIMVSTDNAPPTFGGLVSATATSTTTIDLSWSPAADNITPQANIQYLIYMSTSSGGQNFASPSFTTSQGAASFTVPGLSPSTTYFFVVRAMDERGLIDSNMVEGSATTFAPPDITPPAFGGLASANAVSTTGINLSWNPAADNVTPSSDIIYLVYMATVSGGQNFAIPNYITSPGSTSFTVPGLNLNTTYHFVVRAKDQAGNIDSNVVEKFATTFATPDITPPTFGGLVSAVAVSATAITLTWNPATDDATPSSEISYYVYMSTISKGQNFSNPKDVVTGKTSVTITELTPNTTYYFVVRSGDKAGNFDANTIEKLATTLSLIFVDLQPTNPVIGFPNISFNVVNNGTFDAVSVTVYVEYTDGYSIDCIPLTISVPAGVTQPVTVTTSFIASEYRIIVDPYNGISESDETNNCISNNPTWCSSPLPVCSIIIG